MSFFFQLTLHFFFVIVHFLFVHTNYLNLSPLRLLREIDECKKLSVAVVTDCECRANHTKAIQQKKTLKYIKYIKITLKQPK